jgi:hypothetical protein
MAVELGASRIWLPYQVYDEQEAASRYFVCFRNGPFKLARIFFDDLTSLNLFELAGHRSIGLTFFRTHGKRVTLGEARELAELVRQDFAADDFGDDDCTVEFSAPPGVEACVAEVEVSVRAGCW